MPHRFERPKRRLARPHIVEHKKFGLEHGFEHAQSEPAVLDREVRKVARETGGVNRLGLDRPALHSVPIRTDDKSR